MASVHRFRFGYQPMGDEMDAQAFRRQASRAEELGYAELFTSDHIGIRDPFLPLVIAAEATTTLRLGPLVVNNEFHNPVLLARAAATFDAITGGRLVLGLGTGYMQSEHDAADIPLRRPPERVTRFDESLTVLRSLLDDGSAQLAGAEVTVDLDDIGVRPVQDRVPFLVGGHGRRVVGLAGRHADIFQFTGLTHDPVTGVPSGGGFTLADIVQRHGWLREAAGERFSKIELSSLVQVTKVGDGADEVRSDAANRIGLDVEQIDESPFLLIGSAEQIVDKCHRLREELGFHHFVIRDAEGFAPVVEALAGT